ncbi:MAG: hypothetical protein PHI71_08460 [Acidiphilium sp.]|nr:hypothetical protein [Acidiphilium sp.]
MTFTTLITILLFGLAAWNSGQLIGFAARRVAGVDFLDRFANSIFVFFGSVVLACVAHLIVG